MNVMRKYKRRPRDSGGFAFQQRFADTILRVLTQLELFNVATSNWQSNKSHSNIFSSDLCLKDMHATSLDQSKVAEAGRWLAGKPPPLRVQSSRDSDTELSKSSNKQNEMVGRGWSSRSCCLADTI